MAATTEDEKLQTTEESSRKPIKSCESDKSKPVSASNTPSDAKKNDSSNVDASAIASKTSPAKSEPPNDVPVHKSLSESCTKEDQKCNSVTTSTPIVSKISKQTAESVPHPQVEQQLAEMMDMDATDVLDDKDNDSSKDTEQQSNASNTSLGDLNDLHDDTLADEMDVSDVSSSIAENENESKTQSPRKKPKKRQPPIMIGYKKRRKVHNKKMDDDSKPESEIGSPISEPIDEKSADESKKLEMSASSDDNASETSSTKSTSRSVSMVDKYCWICHRDGASSHKCIACPRVYHQKCLMQPVEDPNNFHCPECSAILKADNVNTRSPVMQAVNLDQLCTLLKHVIDIIKIQKDAHYFLGPVDTREFPHYREYVVYPMDILTLEKNIKNKVYGCTEAFLADMKWIVHNSVVFNTKAAKITNVAKNLLKTCKREVLEIETCAECYYNLLVRKDTWFIEVCKRPHLLIWARLKGYPPWPAKALKCKDEMVDCRFFGAHDKAWVPLKDCYVYSKVPPGIIKIKPGSNLDEGLQEIDKHINKLKDKFGKFVYAEYRVPYNPAEEMKQLQTMLPNFDPSKVASVTKPSVQIDQSKTIKPKCLFDDSTTSTSTPAAAPATVPTPTPSPNNKSSPSETKSVAAKPESSSEEPSKPSTDVSESTSAAAKVADDESNASNSSDGHVSTGDEAESTVEEESTAKTAESSQTEVKISTASSDTEKAQDATDTEAEESDSSRSTTKSTTSGSEISQNAESAKKKVVSVKKIETINAVVAPEKSVKVPVPIAPKPMPGLVPTIPVSVANIANSNIVSSSGQLTRRITDTKMEMIRNVKAVDEKNKPKSVITVKNFASFEKCDSLVGKSPPTQAPPLAPISSSRREPAKVTRKASSEHNFNLDNVKEEPVEAETSSSSEDPIFVKEVPPPPPPPPKVIPNKPIQPKSTVDMAHRKRSLAEDTDSTSTDGGKKAKNDAGVGCRTVNITENVTLSLINNQAGASVVESVPAAVPTKTQPVIKMKQPPKTHVVAPNVSSSDTQTQMTPFAHASIIAKPVRIAPAPGPMATPIRMFTTTAQQQRIVNGNTTINGTTVPSRSNILLVQSPKQPIKPTFGQNGSGEIIVQFMSELLNNNRKAMEDALDKIAGKGDLRAKVILLQKEIENMKKSHDIMIEEIKRDYEVQIAELRAASLAQKKYDLAHERLKFEKEKELAVKEAKSKQWCSNCQKSANYYCCWNTAYCDFECQKEHWNQHMPVCKNDVKRKAAECSENEPPRIMMQNEVLNDYQSMMNGYDKINTNTYAYQNSNSISLSSRSNGGMKIQPKSASNKSNQRPLLPRVTATVTCSPSVFSSSTPMVTATLVDNSYHQNVSSSVAPMRNTMIASVNMHPLIRQVQQQFHK